MAARQGQSKAVGEGRRRLRCKVGDIHRQRLIGDIRGVVVGKKVHAGDQRVGGDDQVRAGGGAITAASSRSPRRRESPCASGAK